jgi:peptidyl-prolyl cis-trans isomerase D
MGFGASGLSGNLQSIGAVGDETLSLATLLHKSTNPDRAAARKEGHHDLFIPKAQDAQVPSRALQIVVAERSLDSEAASLAFPLATAS